MAFAWNKALAGLRRGLRAAWAVSQLQGRDARAAQRRGPTTDLESLAQRLQHFERELGRARVGYARKHLSRQQLEQLCRHVVTEVRSLLGPLRLVGEDADVPAPSWATQRLHEVLRRWHERTEGLDTQPLQQGDVSDVQAQLLELTTALYLCAHVQGGDGAW